MPKDGPQLEENSTLKQSVEGENYLNFLVCDGLVLAVDGFKYDDAGMSTRPWTTF